MGNRCRSEDSHLLEVVELYSQGLAAAEVVNESIVRLGVLVWILLREIDEVGAVREDVAGCVVCVLAAEGSELVSVLVLQRRVLPLPL